MLVIHPTGSGKALIVYQVGASMIKVNTLFVSPLLALASDQTLNLKCIWFEVCD